MRIYIDSSALVKIVIAEQETAALAQYLVAVDEMICSRIGEIELRRVLLGNAAFDRQLVAEVSDRLVYRELTIDVATLASRIGPPELRTLDAIHLATALELGAELDALVTYDDRLAAAGKEHGLRVVAPG